MPAKSSPGVAIEEVESQGICDRRGLVPGDRLVSVNGHRVSDIIDLLYYGNEPELTLEIDRKGQRMAVGVSRGEGCRGDLGLGLRHFRVKTCRNKCLFCFVSQLPRGLRKALYVRDEDYRMSFLYGSYVTLTNLSEEDKRRIVEQHLSPLYVSVHSTDQATRNQLIGNPDAPDIVREIRFFADHGIRMHTQIVLCPGYNDGHDLARTIGTLYRFHPYVASVAVVPVGLTAHRKRALRPVLQEDAASALATVHRFQARFRRKHGESVVYGSDELYIKAGSPFPPVETYDDFPQIANGVGMVPDFLQEGRKARVAASPGKGRFVTFTGVSFHPFLSKFVERIRRAGHDLKLLKVTNSFFGESVTVTGLLTGRDVMKALSESVRPGDTLLIPDVVMKEGQEVFLDDVSRQDVGDFLRVRTEVIESTPRGLLRALQNAQPADPALG